MALIPQKPVSCRSAMSFLKEFTINAENLRYTPSRVYKANVKMLSYNVTDIICSTKSGNLFLPIVYESLQAITFTVFPQLELQYAYLNTIA